MSVPQNRFMLLEDESSAPKAEKLKATKPQKVQKPKGIAYITHFSSASLCKCLLTFSTYTVSSHTCVERV